MQNKKNSNIKLKVLMQYITWKLIRNEDINQKFIDKLGEDNFRLCIKNSIKKKV